jgi:hypothetical protein
MKKNATYLILLLIISIGIACDCPDSFGYKNSDYVFYGKVIKKQSFKFQDLPLYKITFKVDSVYKGKVSSEFTVFTPQWESMCGESFKLSENYYVFSFINEDKMNYTILCYENTSKTAYENSEWAKKRLFEALKH